MKKMIIERMKIRSIDGERLLKDEEKVENFLCEECKCVVIELTCWWSWFCFELGDNRWEWKRRVCCAGIGKVKLFKEGEECIR